MATTADDDEDDDPVRVISNPGRVHMAIVAYKMRLFGFGSWLYRHILNMGRCGSGVACVEWL